MKWYSRRKIRSCRRQVEMRHVSYLHCTVRVIRRSPSARIKDSMIATDFFLHWFPYLISRRDYANGHCMLFPRRTKAIVCRVRAFRRSIFACEPLILSLLGSVAFLPRSFCVSHPSQSSTKARAQKPRCQDQPNP